MAGRNPWTRSETRSRREARQRSSRLAPDRLLEAPFSFRPHLDPTGTTAATSGSQARRHRGSAIARVERSPQHRAVPSMANVSTDDPPYSRAVPSAVPPSSATTRTPRCLTASWCACAIREIPGAQSSLKDAAGEPRCGVLDDAHETIGVGNGSGCSRIVSTTL